MGIVSGGGGGTTAAQVATSGRVVPSAHPTGATVDTTTYADPFAGGANKLTTLVLPSTTGALAIAIAGDAFPRWLFAANPHNDGLYVGDGSTSPYTTGSEIFTAGSNELTLYSNSGVISLQGAISVAGIAEINAATTATSAPMLRQLSPLFTITSGALPTVALVSGTGAQISTARDAETVTPFSGDGTNNAATCAIALSPDNVTYSTLATISIAAALNLTGVLTDNINVRVPAGWYVKLTATHGTLGTTTYY